MLLCSFPGMGWDAWSSAWHSARWDVPFQSEMRKTFTSSCFLQCRALLWEAWDVYVEFEALCSSDCLAFNFAPKLTFLDLTGLCGERNLWKTQMRDRERERDSAVLLREKKT